MGRVVTAMVLVQLAVRHISATLTMRCRPSVAVVGLGITVVVVVVHPAVGELELRTVYPGLVEVEFTVLGWLGGLAVASWMVVEEVVRVQLALTLVVPVALGETTVLFQQA